MARQAPPPTDLKFTVTRRPAELVPPAKPTPHEFKLLSDIDDQEGIRFHIDIINFYPSIQTTITRDPVAAIREALSRALVHYYPLAGRLREVPGGRKLAVECTGEGILFIEADADVALQQFGQPILPPIPCLDQLLFDVRGGSPPILHSPLMLIQVTRLRCGGFVFALRLNHTTCDGTGLLQFLNTVAEMVRGASSPSVVPVWERGLLCTRDPPHMEYTHHEFDNLDESKDVVFPFQDMTHASFFFRSSDISAIKKQHASGRGSFSTFEVLAACIWRCAIRALRLNSGIQIRTVFPVNVRNRFSPPIPKGYYGNAYALAMAITTAGQLCENPLEYALELVKSAKERLTEEYMRSLIDFLVIGGKPSHTSVGASYVSVTMGFDGVDFGWGKPVYGSRAKVWGGAKARVASLFIPLEDYRGENGIVVSIYLPHWVVERFADEVSFIINAFSSAL